MRTATRIQRQDIEPDDDESYEDFMSRCGDEIGDEDVCQMIWDERAAEGIRYKTHLQDKIVGREFVMSDETPDRMDDIIVSDGWDLTNFRKNPTALFGHKSDFIIGEWTNVRVENKQLRGHLKLAQRGTSTRINEVISLVEQGFLRAVSVGFRPKESKPRAESDFGVFWTKAELVETSLVAVPANPNALAVARSLKISPATLDLVFAGKGARGDIEQRGSHGGQADTPSRHRNCGPDIGYRKSEPGKGTTMSFAQRITAGEQRINALRDQLKTHYENVDDTNVSDEQVETANDLNARITQEERGLNALRDAERNLGESSDDGGRTIVARSQSVGHQIKPYAEPVTVSAMPRPFAVPKKKLDWIDLLVRSGVVQMMAHRHHKPIDLMMREIYGDDETTRAVVDWQVKAASAPAMTTVTGWAAELAQTIYTGFMETLYPKAIYPRLSGYGLSLSFGSAGKIVIPTRAITPTIAGSFVGEGLPIPVRQGLFTSQTLTPKKMAVITSWTREIDQHSVPAIEGILRNAVQEDTAISLDSVLIDANPATTVRPAGILNGITVTTATAGGGFAALVGDIGNLSGALLTGTKGNVRNPVWLMNPQQINKIGLTAAPGAGVFPFREEIGAGRLGGWPVIDSGTIPLGTVIVMDAADFVAVGGEAPRFEISDQATLHFEDTTPTDITTTGTPPVAAYPVKSMWQTDSLALRLILPTNWTIRRAGVVAWTQSVTW
jgi:HK97 family phage prohead protease